MICPVCQCDTVFTFCPNCGQALKSFDSFPIYVGAELARFCVSWHGGQASAMYSVASTGRIDSADTLHGLVTDLCQIARLTGKEQSKDADMAEKWIERLERIQANLADEDAPKRP